MKNREAEERQENYARIFEVLNRLDEVAFKGYALDNYCGIFATEWSQILGMDYGFLVLKRSREENLSHPGLHGKYAKRPGDSEFFCKTGADRLGPSQPEKPAHHPPQSRHIGPLPVCSGRESPSSGHGLGNAGAQTSLGYELALVFLSRQVLDWNADSERAVGHGFHFLLLHARADLLQGRKRGPELIRFLHGSFSATAFESRVEGIFHASMQSNAPFTLGLIQFEPWQILTTKVLPKRIRQLQRELASSLCDALPPGVLVGQLAQNRFGVLFAETTVQEAQNQLAELGGHGKIALKGIKGVRLYPYISAAGFPQDAAKIEDLWPLVSQRLFSAFGLKPEKANS